MSDESNAPRPIEPAMQPLWGGMDTLANTVDAWIEAMTGERHGFCVMVFPSDRQFACCTISNIKSGQAREAIRDFLAAADAGRCHAEPIKGEAP
jgi:hypothetical protein